MLIHRRTVLASALALLPACRTASAQAKIAQAEALAIKEVRAVATDLAVAAAAKLIAAQSARALRAQKGR